GLDIFDRQYRPIAGSNPPRYHTLYDSALEPRLQPLLDNILAQIPAGYYAVVFDDNGYCPTHNSRYCQEPTGDPEHDKIHVRHKRIFNDEFSLAAVKNPRGVLCQTHMRDTGDIVTDLSLPLDIAGRRWGGGRLGVDYHSCHEPFRAAVRLKSPGPAVADPCGSIESGVLPRLASALSLRSQSLEFMVIMGILLA